MSRPRAATSLHTSRRSSLALNFSSVAKRTVCAMSPCSAPASNLCRVSDLCRMSTSLLRLQKISAFCTFCVRISRRSASRLSCSATSARPSVIVVATEAGRETAISFGLCRNASARRRISGPIVAEKNSVCRVRGSSETIRSTSGMKPMSSMRSASSITRILVSVSRMVPRSNMSSSRPGVAISTSTPRIQHVLLVGHALAADDQRVGQLQILAVLDEVLGHLQREFARRLQDQAARHAGAGARAGQNVQHRQGEAGGLAGAGLRRAHHVAAHQHERDRLFLDRRRMAIAHVVDGAQHRLGQAEIGEGRARWLRDDGRGRWRRWARRRSGPPWRSWFLSNRVQSIAWLQPLPQRSHVWRRAPERARCGISRVRARKSR